MRSTFLGTGAFVGMIEGDCRCSFWADEPTDHGFDKTRLISIDLSRSPSAAAARAIDWSDVEVDDCILSSSGKPSGTTIGPRWPEMQLLGAVYLEQNTWARIPEPMRPLCPPAGAEGRDYEFMTAVYWPHTDDPRAGMRYSGHHAEIIEEQGTLAHVAIFPAGASTRPDAQPMAMWIDLADPEQCDAGVDSLTQIGTGDAPKAGALFLPSGRLEVPAELEDVPAADEDEPAELDEEHREQAVQSDVVLPPA